MAITVIAATSVSAASGASASSSVSATAGNSLIVGGSAFGGSAWSVTRTGDTYTNDTTYYNGGVTANTLGISSAPNVAGGAVNMTVSSTGANGISTWAAEVGGLPSSAIRDAASPAVATGTTGTPTSNALSNVTANAIYFCAFSDSGVGNETITPGAGWTVTVGGTTMDQPNGSTNMVGGLEYQIVSTTASRTGSWTENGVGPTWACGVAVYKGAAGGVVLEQSHLLFLGVS